MCFLFNDQTRFDVYDLDSINKISIMICIHSLYEILLSCIQAISIFVIFNYIKKFLEARNEKKNNHVQRWKRSDVDNENKNWKSILHNLMHNSSENVVIESERRKCMRTHEFKRREKCKVENERVIVRDLKMIHVSKKLFWINCNLLLKKLQSRKVYRKLDWFRVKNERLLFWKWFEILH